jgi:DNA polymerase III sliding clamp (beta) subunit (PCNA family)
MLLSESLAFVKGAVAKKDYQPALTHFRIKDGRVIGYNGIIALSCPIDLDLVACPKASTFIKAIDQCKSAGTSLHLTPAGRLSIKSGPFRALIECTEESELLDTIQPEGEGCELPGEIISAFRTLRPFIGDDASRPWSNGVTLRGQSAYATNNIIIGQYWVGQEMPEINVPELAINELIRIGKEPMAVTLGERSITFHFENGSWLRSQLLNGECPIFDRFLEQEGSFEPFPTGIFDAIEKLKPFLEDEKRIYFRKDRICTSFDGETGASLEVEGVPEGGAYHYEQIMLLQGVVQTIDFSPRPPKPCPFRGNKMRGIILGMYDA